MDKKEFERQLLDYLDIFEDEVIHEEVNICMNKISHEQGLSEVEAVANLGKPEDVAREIYQKHGVAFSKVHKKHGFIYHKFEQLFQVVHRLVDVMSKNDLKSNAKIVLDILILIAFVAILKIPFIVVQNLGDSLLSYLAIPVISDIWSLLMDLIYIVVAVIVFINIFQKYFKNIQSDKKATLKTNGLESVSLEDLTKK